MQISLRNMILRSVLCLLGLALFSTPGRADLKAYLARPEPVFAWENKGSRAVDGGQIHSLRVVSQQWQNTTWEHDVQVFRPETIKNPDFCLLYNTGGRPNPGEEEFGMTMARSTQNQVAIVYGVPNQPLFDGKTEDALIAFSWQKYLQTGDESWPLLFPMVKSVVKSMDAIQAATEKAGHKPVKRFLVTGASKRGWTSWLTAAGKDPRVVAIAPMVIDMLNFTAQIPHQIASYGKPSEQIGDYTAAGLIAALVTPQGRRLVEMQDPYTFRQDLTLPKLLILGTNDPYWTQDALNLYWDGLTGQKWVLYTPNSGHGLNDRGRVMATLSAFTRSIAGRKSLPKANWTYTENGNHLTLSATCSTALVSARIWRAEANTRDFRKAQWSETPLKVEGKTVRAELKPPSRGFAATFAEMTLPDGTSGYTISTQLRILGADAAPNTQP